jgi:hypothetical protein
MIPDEDLTLTEICSHLMHQSCLLVTDSQSGMAAGDVQSGYSGGLIYLLFLSQK